MSLAIDTSAERMVGEQAHRHSVLDERTEPNMTLDGANIHLVGPGRVGRAFLDLLVGTSYRLVGVTDSTATCHDRDGLAPEGIAALKANGGSLRERPDSEALPVNLAVEMVNADVLVDATPTAPGREEEAIQRGRDVLRRGRRLVLAAKDALCCASGEWLRGVLRSRVGCNAVLGGTGLALMQELEELAEECEQVALVPNASTASILEVVEAGGTLEAGIQRARCRGFLEADPSLDLDGTDAAVKLAIVATALWQEPISPKQISRQDIRSLDPQVIRGRAARGSTTRLVARAHRNGPMQVAYEGLPRTSALSTPTDRVVYTYALKNGRSRVHTGCGLGPVETARALLQDLVGLTSLEGVA